MMDRSDCHLYTYIHFFCDNRINISIIAKYIQRTFWVFCFQRIYIGRRFPTCEGQDRLHCHFKKFILR